MPPIPLAEKTGNALPDALLETAPVGLLVCDESGRITQINAVARDYFGYKRDELLDKPVEILLPHRHQQSHIESRAALATSPAPRPIGHGRELVGLRKDGTEFPVEIGLMPLRTPHGIVTTAVIVDLTERRKAEAHSRVSQQLEAAQRLAAAMANEFNNIFAAILGSTKLAVADLAEGKLARETLSAVEKSVWRGSALVRQLSALQGRLPAKCEPMDLVPAVEQSLPLIRALLPSNTSIRTTFAAGVPEVFGDAAQIEQVLLALASNAAHAMGEHGGTLELEVKAVTVSSADANGALREGNYVRLSVSDTGSGMDTATVERIFEPFFTNKPIGGGTGLGLYVVHDIVNKHDGAITVDSTLGKGTTVHVYLPLAGSHTQPTPGKPSPVSHLGRGELILYVDDDAALVELVTQILKRLNYQVTGCTDPIAALELFRSNPEAFHAVVSDISMPGMTGIDLARELLRIRPGIPILMTSGCIRPQDVASMRNLDLPDLISKPDAIEDLGNIIHDLLARECARKSNSEKKSKDDQSGLKAKAVASSR